VHVQVEVRLPTTVWYVPSPPAHDEYLRRRCSTPAAGGWTGTPPPDDSTASPRPLACLPRMHPHMLRHTYVTTMLDAGVDLRDVQTVAHHADPRPTTHYDRARQNLDRHPNHILAAYMPAGT